MAYNRTQLHVFDRTVNAKTYRDQILTPIVQPFMRRHMPNGVFQHDNAMSYITRPCTQYLQTNTIVIMDWLTLSPDLSPIVIIIITLFQEDNIFGRVASLTYGPHLTNVGMIL